MNFLFSLSEATETIRHNKMRTFLTMLGMNIGVGAIIAIISIGLMARSSIMDGVGDLGASLVVVQTNRKAYDDGVKPIRATPFDGINLKQLLPEAVILPYLTGNEAVYSNGSSVMENIIGVGSGYNDVWDRPIEDGRFFTNEDHEFRRKTVILGWRAAQKHFGDENPEGKSIKIGNQVYTVVGILEKRSQETMSDGSSDTSFFVPLETYLRYRNFNWYGKPYISYIIIKVENMDRLDEMVNAIEVYFFSRYGQEGDVPRFRVEKSQDDIESFNKVFDIITLVISLIAGLSLLVSGMGIMNIMLVAITERTKEIGIRKSIGAQNGDILQQFLIEAVIICLMGGGIGVILGMLISFLVALSQEWPYLVPLFSVAAGVGVSIAIGLFFGIYPAMRAAKLDPIKALSRD